MEKIGESVCSIGQDVRESTLFLQVEQQCRLYHTRQIARFELELKKMPFECNDWCFRPDSAGYTGGQTTWANEMNC